MTQNNKTETKQQSRVDLTQRNKVLTQLALKQATSNPVKVFGMVKVFFLQNDWQGDWLRQEESIVQPQSFNELKEAVEGNTVKTILITDALYVPVSALAFICAKATSEKIIFLENED